jgi:hypothetical protein
MNYQDAIDSAQQREFGDLSWNDFSDSFEDSLERLEEIVNDVSDLRQVCSDEWCDATECLLGEATIAAFAISEPHWASEEDSKRLRDIKKRIHGLHLDKKPAIQ